MAQNDSVEWRKEENCRQQVKTMMRTNGKRYAIFLLLTAAIFVAGIPGCASGQNIPPSNQTASNQHQPSNKPPVSPSIPPTTSPGYPEPSIRPPGLGPEWIWNPHGAGTFGVGYYDSKVLKYHPQVTDGLMWNTISVSRDARPTQTEGDWLKQHENSTDEIDIAFIKYWKALQEWNKKQALENPEEWAMMERRAGNEKEGGPISILADIGIPKLQRLVDRILQENPFVTYIEIGAGTACRTHINEIGQHADEIVKWKYTFNDRALNGKYRVDAIVQELASGRTDESIMHRNFAMMGIFALPRVYELVIEKGNTDLIKYLPDMLPLEKMKEYNIKAGETDDATLKQALASCNYYIEYAETQNSERVLSSSSRVDELALGLASGKADEKTIIRRFMLLGIFALPEIYELVINQGNTSLIKYLPDILPLDKMKEYNIVAGQTDDATLRKALASCKDYIEIIKSLHAD